MAAHRKAFAKITLVLSALGKESGKVRFQNVTVPIDLFDSIYLEVADDMCIETNKSYLPNDQRNTVFQAIKLMKEKFQIEDNFHIRIIKNIPAQSGLGGGSADAAAVIRLLDDYYQLNMSREAMIEIAKKIDEDTPFCLFNQPAIVEGMGEELTPIKWHGDLYYVLIKPAFGVSTKSFLRRQNTFESHDASIEQVKEAIESGQLETLYPNTFNAFQKHVIKTNYRLKFVIRDLKRQGLNGICMSGTGTTVYGLTTDKEKAIAAHEALVTRYPFVKYGTVNQSHGKLISEENK